jgi:hypothetical protein
MDDNPAKTSEAPASQKLRLAEPQPIPENAPRAHVPSSEAPDAEETPPSRPAIKAPRPKVDDQPGSIQWRPIVFALVILFAAGTGIWRWRTITAPKPATIESPLDYHKREFLAALRGTGSNAPPMQLRADRMRFHQKALMSLGFLEERRFTLPKGRKADSHLGVGRLEGVDHQFAMIEPRPNNVLVVIAPREDMPAWETLIGKPDQQ